jgi:hypothetical protein
MQPLIILISLAFVVMAYIFVSRREDNWVNILTPFLLFSVPGWYVLELVYGSVFGYEASVYAYFYCYLTYALGVGATVAGYIAMPARPLGIFIKVPRIRIPGVPFLFLAFAVLLYAGILIKFPGLLVSPRQIYELTRSGFGLQFFLSAFAVYMGFILLLFSPRKNKVVSAVFWLVSLVVLYLHGSKGQLLNWFLVALYFFVFVAGKRFDFKRVVGLAMGAICLISSLFYITSYGSAASDLLLDMANYADYTRNAAMIIDDQTLAPQMGRLAAESKLYIMVPRALFPDKPKDYGGFWLVKRYYPDKYELEAGAPDLGLGFLYADFGAFAIVYYCIGALLAGVSMKVLVTRLRQRPDAGTFLLLLVFLDVGLIPTGAGGLPLILYYALAHLANSLAPKLPPRSLSSNRLAQSGGGKEEAGDAGIVA